MKTGILGLPGSGKSTLFDLVTESPGGPDPSHPPNKPRIRSVKVHDERLERLRDDYKPKKWTPAALEILDFPAVAAGERDRSGLADLLAPAREVDALVLVLRDFVNPMIPGGDKIDPASDFSEVIAELMLSDLVIVERRLEKLAEKSRRPTFSDEDRRECALLEGIKARLEKEDRALCQELSAEDVKRLSGFGFLSAKPYLTVLSGESGQVAEERLREMQEVTGSEVLVVAARNEQEILELPEGERQAFLDEYGIQEFMRDPLIRALYRAADRISFFTANEREVRAWTLPAGGTAIQAAATVHTDFARGFIRAEVVSHEDYLTYGGTRGAKDKGHYRLEGREYVVEDADLIEFRFSV